MSAVIFGTVANWHLCVFSSKLTVWLITLCVVFFQHSMCWGDQPVQLYLLTLDLLRYQGLELVSFRTLLFYFVFDCEMGCMNLYLLVKVWVFLKTSVNRFYKSNCPLFVLALRLFSLSPFLFPRHKIAWGSFELIGSMPLLMLFLVLSS